MLDTSRDLPVPTRSSLWPGYAMMALGPMFGAAYALWLGQDRNFDQLNYHFESVYEFFNQRLAIDAAPSGIVHSYFNPVPYIPFYEMARRWPPQFVILALGAWHGVNVTLAYALAYLLAPARGPGRRAALAALATIVSVAGAMTLSEVGSSMADLALSPLVLLAVLLLVAAPSPGRTAGAFALPALAAALVGLAIGLKLTHALYGCGLAVACAIGWRSRSERLLSLFLCGFAGALGVAASGGFWFLTLWRQFQSPVFPYYDGMFHSPAIDTASELHGQSFRDTRFLPGSLSDALRLPFRWMESGQSTSELAFRDIRFAVFFVLLLVGVAALVWRFPKPRTPPDAEVHGRRTAVARLLAFFVVAYVVWLDQFAIQRYLVVLELLLGPALLAILGWLVPARLLPYALAAIAAAAALTVSPPDWGHVKEMRADWFDVKLPPVLLQPALVLATSTTSYVAPFLPPASIVVGVTDFSPLRPGRDGVLNRTVDATLARTPPLPVVLLTGALLDKKTRRALGALGLSSVEPCQPVPNAASFLVACVLQRGASVGWAAAKLSANETLAFGASGGGLPALFSGWNPDSSWGWIGTDYHPQLLLSVGPTLAGAPTRLSFRIVGFGDEFASDDALTLQAGDRVLAAWPKPAIAGPLVACVPAELFAPAKPTLFTFGYRRHDASAPGAIVGAMGLVSVTAERGGCEPIPIPEGSP